jgi:hypothetical protein
MTLRRLAIAAVVLSAGPALADGEGPVTHTDQLVVVTPNAPIVITQGQPMPGQQIGAGPSTVAPVAPVAVGNGAPQNEPWQNVSHINGTLVKVGEKQDYLLSYKKLNIATNPIGWIVGIYGVSASYALGQNVAIRGDANYFNMDNERGYEIGVSAPIYFRRVYSGPFIEPGIVARGFESMDDYAYDCYDCSSSTSTLLGPEVLFGWHWTFDSGLNIAAALGAARDVSGDANSSSDPEPVGYFRIGYAM